MKGNTYIFLTNIKIQPSRSELKSLSLTKMSLIALFTHCKKTPTSHKEDIF